MEPFRFQELLVDQKITVTDRQLSQFEKYYLLLIEWNERINLTAITEKSQVYEKHFFDSVAASFYFDFTNSYSLIDIGAGAGFPSLPLKIMNPHIHITIVDSLNKRILFLEKLCRELGLDGVTCVHGRAEELAVAPQYREQFDTVSARAVARLNVLAEYCLPFAKVGGTFIALKGADASIELNEAKKAIKTLGGETRKMESFLLPVDHAERSIILIDKVSNTPKGYPRKAGTPAKKPLV